MSGFARHLPLSQREGDERAITSDRREALATVIERAADLCVDAPAEAGAFARAAALGGGASDAPALRTRAGAVRHGPKQRTRALAAAVRALLELAARRGVPPELDPGIAGVVAFYAAGRAPGDRRAVIRGRTVRASDADWSFGAGPVLEGTATGIAAFLLGVSDTPPQPVTPRR